MRSAKFWGRTEPAPSGCILWLGPTNRKGYGVIARRVYGESLAHRYAYRLEHGDIPAGSCVLHRCDIPRCVSPAHLFLGSIADNNADMRAKGRHARGERNHLSRLTSAIASAIRTADGPQSAIASRFGVNQATVSRIKAGRIWRQECAS